jgi:hypothetical protein
MNDSAQLQPPPTRLRPGWVFIVVLLLSVLALARTQQYYGTIYHGWDAQFYYSLAHSLVFDRDVDVTNNLQLTPAPKPFDPDGDGSWKDAPRRPDGRIPSKYPIGLSLVEAPFLVLGSLVRQLAAATGLIVPGNTGYSVIELWSVALGLLVLFAYGLAELYQLLATRYGDWGAVLGIMGGWLGTSLCYYSTIFPFMAHALAFVLLVLAMRTTRRLLMPGPINRPLALLGICLAALFLVRPQQILIAGLLLPILARCAWVRSPSEWVVGALFGISVNAAAVAAQVSFNYSQFGTLTLSGYAVGNEGFSWMHPQLSLVLFSSSRGLLMFSPVVVLTLLGFILFPRSIPVYVWPFVGNAVAQLYLIAAWSSPEQGEAFGVRMWSDNAAVVSFGLAVLIHRSRLFARLLVSGATLGTLCWSLLLLVRYVVRG